MTIGIIFNPSSGRGRAEGLAHSLYAALEKRGVKSEIARSEKRYDPRIIDEFLASLKALYVIGGDGTLMDLLPAVSRIGVPLYMVPAGNESLFARHFEMTRDIDAASRAIDRTPTHHYYGMVGDNPFFTMVSLGLDSLIIERISRSRTGPIGRRGYVLPALLSAARFRQPKVVLRVDGKVMIDGEPGYVIIANNPEYAMGLNPVREAASTAPRLHARFFPGDDRGRVLPWMARAVTRSPVSQGGSLNFEGRSFELHVTGGRAFPLQADGEFAGMTPMRVQISRGTIAVLA